MSRWSRDTESVRLEMAEIRGEHGDDADLIEHLARRWGMEGSA
ncbi:hypothetical protein [Halalkalicoccus jeotgali]|uniref:Uncharacterized protein n=1 Tax=Halalkalicoccus jeotgali (strain DSM 18796 / CECT 7217 / JCM 14584 / KCTC 4019 / B3) TaxID=795797 RepID=D8J9N1_HALJB|nr:hypothetical protein [Halalkalicoccus jeotgali]ADJ14443.1 hypothetical protein HacjB3_05260 [Halalkalicoccus jeotgali B3]ELY40159.1 hypothetical protein C497_03645 [Halalkalicoccus jeotgali B3]